MTKNQHVHKLRRLKYKTGNAIFFCALPDCNYKVNTALALGKRSLCWRCDEPFIMNEYSLRLAKPHCEKCHKPKYEPLDISRGPVLMEKTIEEHNIEVANEKPKKELSLSERLAAAIKQNKEDSEDDI